MPLTPDQVDAHIRRRPSVHQICLGAFIQHSLFVNDDVLAVPLSPLGFNDVSLLVGDYASADLLDVISVEVIDKLKENGKHTYPAVALVWHPTIDAPATTLVPSALPSLTKAQHVLAWVSGESVTPVAYVILHMEGSEYQVIPPSSRRRQRLWFDISEMDQFQLDVIKLAKSTEIDLNLAFALELFCDATKETNDIFRIAKLYNVLECLASKHKKGGVGSRDAIRKILNIDPKKDKCAIQDGECNFNFDLIAVAGRLRDKILHGGSKLEESDLAIDDRNIFKILIDKPHLIAHELQWRIEEEIQKRVSYFGLITKELNSK